MLIWQKMASKEQTGWDFLFHERFRVPECGCPYVENMYLWQSINYRAAKPISKRLTNACCLWRYVHCNAPRQIPCFLGQTQAQDTKCSASLKLFKSLVITENINRAARSFIPGLDVSISMYFGTSIAYGRANRTNHHSAPRYPSCFDAG